MSAIIIYLCGFTLFFKYCINNYLRNKEERAAKATVEVTKDDKAKEGGEGK
jgi:simple sugar transport system permease protein